MGCKDLIPPEILAFVQKHDFEAAVLAAHDRAFEEQRFYAILWDVLQAKNDNKLKKNLYKAIEQARTEALGVVKQAGVDGDDALVLFANRWVSGTITRMRSQAAPSGLET